MIESGRVFIPAEADWRPDFQHELVNFPKGKYDDQVDSFSQFLNWAKRSLGTGTETVTLIPGGIYCQFSDTYLSISDLDDEF